MWDDSNPGHRHSWKLFALALLVSTGAHFIIVAVVPGFGAAPESITLEVTIMSKHALAPRFETNPSARQGARASVQQRAAPMITTPAPSNITPPGAALLIPQASADKPAPLESAVPLPSPGNNGAGNERAHTLLRPDLLDAQMKVATEAYLEEQKQAACSDTARKHALAECPSAVQDTARVVNNPKATILPPLVPEEHPLTDAELERRASVKGIPLFNFKF